MCFAPARILRLKNYCRFSIERFQ